MAHRALESVSTIMPTSALSNALTIHARSERINARQSKLLTSYSSEEGVVAGHSGQFTAGGYLQTL